MPKKIVAEFSCGFFDQSDLHVLNNYNFLFIYYYYFLVTSILKICGMYYTIGKVFTRPFQRYYTPPNS